MLTRRRCCGGWPLRADGDSSLHIIKHTGMDALLLSAAFSFWPANRAGWPRSGPAEREWSGMKRSADCNGAAGRAPGGSWVFMQPLANRGRTEGGGGAGFQLNNRSACGLLC